VPSPANVAELRRLPFEERLLHQLAEEAGREGSRQRLSPAEEADLAQRAQAGDRNARDRLLASSLWLVVKAARRHVNATRGAASMLDCVQFGFLGVWSAIRTFDPRKGGFRAHARTSAMRAVRRGTAETSRTVGLSRPARTWLGRYDKALWVLTTRLERFPTPAEIGEVLGIPPESSWDPKRPLAAWHPRQWTVSNLEELAQEWLVSLDELEASEDDPDGSGRLRGPFAFGHRVPAWGRDATVDRNLADEFGEAIGTAVPGPSHPSTKDPLADRRSPTALDELLAKERDVRRRIQGERLRDEINRLATPLADVIDQHYFGERSFTDIARARGCSRPRVSQLHRAGLRSLRDVLERDDWFSEFQHHGSRTA
jgi:RNA polymerase sigma factor (sigma-70 family)